MNGKKAKRIKRALARHRKYFEEQGYTLPGDGLKHHPHQPGVLVNHPDSPKRMGRKARKRWGKGVPFPYDRPSDEERS